MVNTDLRKELCDMRAAYQANPIKHRMLSLLRPSWLTERDGLARIFREKDDIYKYGNVYYACIVQANNNLYRTDNRLNCPANLLYTLEPSGECNIGLLKETAKTLNGIRKYEKSDIPEHMRELISVMTDDHDRSQFIFTAGKGDEKLRMIYACTLIFREDLPLGVLKNDIIPVLAAPEHCTSILTLPKKYWSEGFIEFWNSDDR